MNICFPRRIRIVKWIMPRETTQIKFTIDADIVSAFKLRCMSEGVSMASAVREWMKTSRPVKVTRPDTDTRPHRRKAVREIISLLEDIETRETEYRDNIPEQFSQRYDDADEACSKLSEAISSLEDAF